MRLSEGRLAVLVCGVLMQSVEQRSSFTAAGEEELTLAGALTMTRVPENPDVLEGTPRLRQTARRRTYQTQRLGWTWFCQGRGGAD